MPTPRTNRRYHERLQGPFDGRWDGASGMRACRITDLSAGGCFIDAMASPEVGTATEVSVSIGDRTYTVPATVAYVDRIQGFAVRFHASEQTAELALAVKARLKK
jgi:hypothetical protein